MTLRKTPFYENHVKSGGRIVDFGGWELPVQYAGIIQEHKKVRESVGLFDVSHMGEVRFVGDKALEAVRYIVTNDLNIVDGQAQYTAMCNPAGGIVDDIIVYRFSAENVLICVNASNREKDYNWLVENNPFKGEVEVIDESNKWAQVAVQGRNARATLDKLCSVDLSEVGFYHFAKSSFCGVKECIVARTGYTGEDGFEVFMPVDMADLAWRSILEAGDEFGIEPAGLGARDTLRLESRMCLYGNDICETTSPLEAGLQWVVKLDGGDFVGKEALVAQRVGGLTRRLVALEVERRIARPHSKIMSEGEAVGEVTSGTKSPTLGKNIALGYVPRRLARAGTKLQVDIRGKIAEAIVVKPPFYKRDYKLG